MPSLAHRLRSALARRFYVALKRAGHRMPVELVVPVRARVLVVAPHIDDEVIACGGTLLLHRALQSTVRVVFVSDSAGGTGDAAIGAGLRATRRAEMAQVRAELGLESVTELDFPDGSLVRHESAIAARLADELRAFAPSEVYCPFPIDGHADHQACSLATAQAMRDASWSGDVYAYEVWSPLWANVGVDIGAVAEAKAALIRMYASQMSDRDYAGAILGLNRYRGLVHRVGHAEAFHRCSPAVFTRLAERLDSLGDGPSRS